MDAKKVEEALTEITKAISQFAGGEVQEKFRSNVELVSEAVNQLR